MKKSEKFWDRLAKSYGFQVSEDDHEAHKTIKNTKKYLQQTDTVLDFGCATGKYAFAFSDYVKEIHGVDISAEMIAHAKTNAEEKKISNVHFAQATIFDPLYEPDSFNVIMAFNILHIIENHPEIFQRIHQLLKPGGMFISASPTLGQGRSFMQAALWVLSKLPVLPHINFYTPTELEEHLKDSSFEILETEVLDKSPMNYFVAAKKI